MEQLARRDRASIIRADSDQSHRVPAAIHKLDFVGPATFMDMHDRSNITTIEPFVGRFAPILRDAGPDAASDPPLEPIAPVRLSASRA